jgi:heme ABC exporter ATP-binding subunit CcmA
MIDPEPTRPASHQASPRSHRDSTVVLRGVVVLLGRFPALAGMDLDVAADEVVLLAGANGAGKTTALRLCAGLVPVAEGDALVLGVDLRTNRSGVYRRVGLVGHDSGLYTDLTVSENMAFFTKASGADPSLSSDALDRLQVAHRLTDLPVRALSTGQRKRVSFAAMLVRRPELWLLDEPHSGLDEGGRDLIDGLIAEAAAAGATVLFASHELERANQVAHRSVVITAGMVS